MIARLPDGGGSICGNGNGAGLTEQDGLRLALLDWEVLDSEVRWEPSKCCLSWYEYPLIIRVTDFLIVLNVSRTILI